MEDRYIKIDGYVDVSNKDTTTMEFLDSFVYWIEQNNLQWGGNMCECEDGDYEKIEDMFKKYTKIKVKREIEEFSESITFIVYHCPSCGYKLFRSFSHEPLDVQSGVVSYNQYCCMCGQSLDWRI